MKIIRVLPAVVLTLVAALAYTQEGKHGLGAKFDADGSEDLSLQEFTEYLKATKQDVAAASDESAK